MRIPLLSALVILPSLFLATEASANGCRQEGQRCSETIYRCSYEDQVQGRPCRPISFTGVCVPVFVKSPGDREHKFKHFQCVQ